MLSLQKTRVVGTSVDSALTDARRLVGKAIHATSCTSDATQVRPGDVFFALVTANEDGHDRAIEAVANGAVAVVVEQMLPLPGVSQYQVDDTAEAFGEFCHAMLGHPSRELPTIATVGNGNRCVARLLSSIWAKIDGKPVWRDSQQAFDRSQQLNTDPTSTPAIASWLANSVVNGATHIAIAASACDMRRHTIAGVSLDAVCVTDLGQRLPNETLQNVRQRVAYFLENLPNNAPLIVSADDAEVCRLVATTERPVMTFGLEKPADLVANVLERHTGGQTFLLQTGNQSVAVETNAIGDRHVHNCLAAAATAIACGATLQQVALGLESCPRTPGELQPIVLGQSFPVFINTAGDATALRSALGAVRQVTTNRVLTVLVEDSNDKATLQSIAAAMSDLVTTSQTPAVDISLRDSFRYLDDLFAAIALAIALAEPGDAVVIAGGQSDSEGQNNHAEIVQELIALRNEATEKTALAG